mmetsp:Transcript_50171/g.93418  ORF Transcript_50171/g.93418 Transcript_50171/m.93418 type:complete len:368 (-) Transcript_50171:172-1275(-)|eukprot:CAMPEP_0114280688 /NCGR_PEP_ID=MMETSP0059-20121206/2572_1 /TAXON_ID=36894 /ORGANISM="Pyramimonas parkeae, Strain CCMP726" /LENGTH=367 /DNA_ID=CAMNT_0001401107 /DNA_START=251 /DNA_END=1354 /DNA_ORIENTATION=+
MVGGDTRRVTQVDSDGTRYEGKACVSTGERQGRGTLRFPDGSFLSASFEQGVPHGQGSYTSAEGVRLEARFEYGALQGPGREIDEQDNVLFIGQYLDGQRHGPGKQFCDGGGVLLGSWCENILEGEACFMFPGAEGRFCRFQGALVGEWQDGEMSRAYYVEGCSPGTSLGDDDGGALGILQDEGGCERARRRLPRRHPRARPFQLDQSTARSISARMLTADPYEQRRVTVAPSTMPGAGEGLFAKIPLYKGEVAAYYNGVRLPHDEVDNRDWSLNDNTIALNEDEVIDVPVNMAGLDVYCASLGHKANHSSEHNAMYTPVFHPRFGDIKCVRMLVDVQAGEEITVDYGYDGTHGYPSWWHPQLDVHK